MLAPAIATRRLAAMEAMSPLVRYATQSSIATMDPTDPEVCDLTLGNPHEPVVPGFVEAIARQLSPRHDAWFAYNDGEPATIAAITARLREKLEVPFEEADLRLTAGAFAGFAVLLGVVGDPGDEIIYNSPPWFCYEPMILSQSLTPVRVRVEMGSFDLDLAAIEAAITPRTRAVIVNSPHNPTGKIYPPTTLIQLGELLLRASERYGKPIYLISDESYREVLLGDARFVSPCRFYPYTLINYTYGKILLTPGQRMGYIAIAPDMPDRDILRRALRNAVMTSGWSYPNAVLQYALPELDLLTIDLDLFTRKRDHLVGGLRAAGYEATLPEGTFYVLVKTPIADDWAFAEHLAAQKVFTLPGQVCELPGYLRLSLTASEAMITRALATFAQAFEAYRT